jgi:hypothetical protein
MIQPRKTGGKRRWNAGRGKGTCLSQHGYVRITRRGPFRDWYEHRKVMFEACQEFCYYSVDGDLPQGFTVDHLDHKRAHNCLGNLLMLDKRIHDSISGSHAATVASVVPPLTWPPGWVLDDDDGAEEEWGEGRE